MTEVQQGESSPKPTKTKKRDQKQSQHSEYIAFDKAVAEGKKLVAALQSNERRLGELADRVEPKYGKNTLARLAKALRVKFSTLNRCRSVYRAWKGIKATSPISAGVASALAAHPAREEIIEDYRKANRKLTVAKARTFMRDYRVAHGKEQEQDQEQGQDKAQEQDPWLDQIRHLEPQLRWKVIEARSWLAELVNFALEAHRKYGHLSQEHIDLEVLRYATVDEPDKLVTTLRLGGLPFIAVADKIEGAHTTPPLLPPPDSTPDQTT